MTNTNIVVAAKAARATQQARKKGRETVATRLKIDAAYREASARGAASKEVAS